MNQPLIGTYQALLPRGVRSGLSDALERFEEDEMVGIVRFGKEDCVRSTGNDSNLLIVFYVQIMPDDFVMQLHRF
ncbi:hypothetical protein AWP93_17575 [Escherichia coli]|nr:hypothetical protein AWP93_17575 [Escherichia coli]